MTWQPDAALDSSDDIASLLNQDSYDDTVPANPVFLKQLREATTRRRRAHLDVLSRFSLCRRWRPGVFWHYPDMATLAKVMAGG